MKSLLPNLLNVAQIVSIVTNSSVPGLPPTAESPDSARVVDPNHPGKQYVYLIIFRRDLNHRIKYR